MYVYIYIHSMYIYILHYIYIHIHMYMYTYIYIHTLLSTCIHITLDAGSPNPEGDKGRSRQEPFWTPGGPWSKSSKASSASVHGFSSWGYILFHHGWKIPPKKMEVTSGVWENHPWKIIHGKSSCSKPESS